MSDNLPQSIVDEIFARLPIKSLIKCSAVCKSWRSMIKSCSFIDTHLSCRTQFSNQNDAHLLLLRASSETKDGGNFSLHWDNNSESGEYTNLEDPLPYINRAIFPPFERFLVRNFEVIGTCNGIVCLAVEYAYFGSIAIIWNPCVRKFVTLPKCMSVTKDGSYRASYAFGYDSHSNDYKVLRTVCKFNPKFFPTQPCEVEVWSLADGGSWKHLAANLIPKDFRPGVHGARYAFVNGALHWIQCRMTDKDKFIVWFDMASELFGETMMPEALTEENGCFISRYEESLALFESFLYLGGTELHIWVMKEYGKAESWTKLMKVQLQQIIVPLSFKRSGEVVFKMRTLRKVRLQTVDPKTRQVKDFGIDRYKYYFIDSFVESLVLFSQANAISY